MTTIGEQMAYYRAVNNLTQEKAADMFGCSKITWCLWESGKQRPTKTNYIKLQLFMKGE